MSSDGNTVPIHLVGLNVDTMALGPGCHRCLRMRFQRTRDPDAFQYYEGVLRRLKKFDSKYDSIIMYVVLACDKAKDILGDWLSSLERTREYVLVTGLAPNILLVAQTRKPLVSAYDAFKSKSRYWLSPDKTIRYYLPAVM